jgi:hypothetical protein
MRKYFPLLAVYSTFAVYVIHIFKYKIYTKTGKYGTEENQY